MQHVEGFHHKRRSFTKEVTQGVLVAVALRQSGGRDAAFRALPEPTNPLGWWKVSNFTTHRQRSSAFTSRDTCSCSLWGHKWSMEKSLRYTHLYIYIYTILYAFFAMRSEMARQVLGRLGRINWGSTSGFHWPTALAMQAFGQNLVPAKGISTHLKWNLGRRFASMGTNACISPESWSCKLSWLDADLYAEAPYHICIYLHTHSLL